MNFRRQVTVLRRTEFLVLLAGGEKERKESSEVITERMTSIKTKFLPVPSFKRTALLIATSVSIGTLVILVWSFVSYIMYQVTPLHLLLCA
jgi:hypothetical protein